MKNNKNFPEKEDDKYSIRNKKSEIPEIGIGIFGYRFMFIKLQNQENTTTAR